MQLLPDELEDWKIFPIIEDVEIQGALLLGMLIANHWHRLPLHVVEPAKTVYDLVHAVAQRRRLLRCKLLFLALSYADDVEY